MGNDGATVCGSSSLNGLGCPLGVRSVVGSVTTGVVTTGVGLGVDGWATAIAFTGSGVAGADGPWITGVIKGLISGTPTGNDTAGIVGVSGSTGLGGMVTGCTVFKFGMDGGGGDVPKFGGVGMTTGNGTGGSVYVARLMIGWVTTYCPPVPPESGM